VESFAVRGIGVKIRPGNPRLLEGVLAKHPRLRVWLMHDGEPWRQETFALMAAHPLVFMDVAAIDWKNAPRSFQRSTFVSPSAAVTKEVFCQVL